MEQVLLTYGPLGLMVLIAGYFIRELYKSNLEKNKAYEALQDKRLEDYKVLLPALQENTAATKALTQTLKEQSELIEKLIVRPTGKRNA